MSDASIFRLWAMGCAHVGTDLRIGGRESLADPIRQAEEGGSEGGPPFTWDIALNLGDLSGSQTPPDDEEGEEVVRQFAASTLHPREHFYNIVGNHDASGVEEECQWWFRKWIDPEGLHPEYSGLHRDRRPYPIDGTWERYSFRVGNILFLMMSDRNDGGPPVGRGDRGGYPAGAVSGETFAWWQRLVEENQDCIIISAHHHMLSKWDVTFVNVAALTRYHVKHTAVPMSRLFTFNQGSDEVTIQCCLHTADHAPQGWYAAAERIARLHRPFQP